MNKNVGLWIDHSNAVIVFISGEENEIKHFNSDTEHHPHSNVDADDVRQGVRTEYLNRYYDEVISFISLAESIYIFGPGEAKGELEKRLKNESHGEKIIMVDSADKMTEPQVVAKVRKHFHYENRITI